MLPMQCVFRIYIFGFMFTVIIVLKNLSIADYYACKSYGIIPNKIATHYSQNYAGILASCLIRFVWIHAWNITSVPIIAVQYH